MRSHNENQHNFFTQSLVQVFVLAAENCEALNNAYRGAPALRSPRRQNRLFDVQQARINLSGPRKGGWDNQPPMMPA